MTWANSGVSLHLWAYDVQICLEETWALLLGAPCGNPRVSRDSEVLLHLSLGSNSSKLESDTSSMMSYPTEAVQPSWDSVVLMREHAETGWADSKQIQLAHCHGEADAISDWAAKAQRRKSLP